MKTTVSTYKLPGSSAALCSTKGMAEQAVRIVERSVRGSMPDVEIILSTAAGMAERGLAAELQLAGGKVTAWNKSRARHEARRRAGEAAGRAIARPDGSVLILINTEQHANSAHLAVTLVHELIHAMQYSRPGVRERTIRDLRHELGVARQSRRQAREHERCVREEEREAYGKEYLADRLVPGATSAAIV